MIVNETLIHPPLVFRTIIKEEGPDILLLQKTKLGEREVLHTSYSIWWGCNVFKVISRGASRGLCTLWPPSIFMLIEKQKLFHWIVLCFLHLSTRKVFNMINAQMLLAYQEKVINTTLHPWEKKGGNLVHDPFRGRIKDYISI